MNVLILTPDAVGSTLLQRMLTIYMQLHDFARPVINLHELTNGLAKYYSPEFNREIVSKKSIEKWGYYQTLEQVVELLSSVDHYKTSRLAHYHIKQRGDAIDQQIPFYTGQKLHSSHLYKLAELPFAHASISGVVTELKVAVVVISVSWLDSA